MTLSTNRTRLVVVLALVASLWLALMPASPADADPGAAVITGTANLPSFPGSGSGTFNGSILVGTTSGSASATFNYNEITCAAGLATGTITVSGHGSAGFQWARVGATAVLVISGSHTGVGVAAFATTDSDIVTACTTGPPASITATVAGVGAFA
jgi:hypothetical protein